MTPFGRNEVLQDDLNQPSAVSRCRLHTASLTAYRRMVSENHKGHKGTLAALIAVIAELGRLGEALMGL